jgi:hypothetical protein
MACRTAGVCACENTPLEITIPPTVSTTASVSTRKFISASYKVFDRAYY